MMVIEYEGYRQPHCDNRRSSSYEQRHQSAFGSFAGRRVVGAKCWEGARDESPVVEQRAASRPEFPADDPSGTYWALPTTPYLGSHISGMPIRPSEFARRLSFRGRLPALLHFLRAPPNSVFELWRRPQKRKFDGLEVSLSDLRVRVSTKGNEGAVARLSGMLATRASSPREAAFLGRVAIGTRGMGEVWKAVFQSRNLALLECTAVLNWKTASRR
jgi:hypothetical protein